MAYFPGHVVIPVRLLIHVVISFIQFMFGYVPPFEDDFGDTEIAIGVIEVPSARRSFESIEMSCVSWTERVSLVA